MKASERLHDKTYPHGTLQGQREGCKGSHCPGKEAVGMTCEAIGIRYARDLSFKRRLDGGLSIPAILAEDQLSDESAVPVKKSPVPVSAEGNTFTAPTVTMADSSEPLAEDEDERVLVLTIEPDLGTVEEVVEEESEPTKRGRKPGPIKHGTKHAYYKRGCRTDEECPRDPDTRLSCRQAAAGKVPSSPVVSPVNDVDELEAAPVVDVPLAPAVLTVEHERPRVRADDLLADLADTKAQAARLVEEAGASDAAARHFEREAIATLEKFEEAELTIVGLKRDVARLTNELVQSALELDVARAARPTVLNTRTNPDRIALTIEPLGAGGVSLSWSNGAELQLVEVGFQLGLIHRVAVSAAA